MVERVGVSERTYPNIFVVRLDEKKSERRVSYSYSDVLTSTVELVVCHQDGDIVIVGALISWVSQQLPDGGGKYPPPLMFFTLPESITWTFR